MGKLCAGNCEKMRAGLEEAGMSSGVGRGRSGLVGVRAGVCGETCL